MPRKIKKGPFSKVPNEIKREMVRIWKTMSEEDKEHFTNQVALALSIWGTDDEGLELIAIIMQKMVEDGSKNLADFGLYIDWFIKNGGVELYEDKKKAIKKASIVVESYRLKYDLPSEPHKSIF